MSSLEEEILRIEKYIELNKYNRYDGYGMILLPQLDELKARLKEQERKADIPNLSRPYCPPAGILPNRTRKHLH